MVGIQDNRLDVCRENISIKYFVWKCKPTSFGRHRSFCRFVVLRILPTLLSLTWKQLPSGILRVCMPVIVLSVFRACVYVSVTSLQLKELFSVFSFTYILLSHRA